MKSPFASIQDFFRALNQADVKYLVLRNYESLLEPELYVDGHGDIDMLCEDSQQIVRLVGARPLTPDKDGLCGDGIHYSIIVDGQPVKLDLRHLGDGYYCTKWEQEMLDRRVGHECFYVMNDEDYFYSLIYHAVLQKRSLGEDYRSRLLNMSRGLGLNVTDGSEREFLRLLQDHMRNNDYRFTYAQDHMVPNRFHLVDEGLIEKKRALQCRHLVFDMKVKVIDWLVELKHCFTR